MNKCAGVSIKDFMIKHMGAKVLKYKHSPIRLLPEEHWGKVKIGCIRNPYAWYVSYYTYHQKNGKFLKMSFKKYINEYTKHPRALLSLMPPKIRKKFPTVYPPRTGMPIGSFSLHYINYFCSDAIHILSKWDIDRFTEHVSEVSDLDVMWRTETLAEDMIKTFGEKYAKKIKAFPRKNVSNKKPYQEYYTPELIEIVRKRDGILMNYLGYEYE
jgi:hypothetical protein